MAGLKVTPFDLPGLALVEGSMFPDPRGFFMESFREDEWLAKGFPRLVQDNFSRSAKGVLRGLHYQKNPSAIGKLVRCARGRIFDVAVDIRKGSPGYGRWVGVELSDYKNAALWVPPGFAHGFCALSETADVLYKVTGYFSPSDDRGILWNDPAVGVGWPVEAPRLSDKDAKLPPLAQADNNFAFSK